jgi:hypothetical protein
VVRRLGPVLQAFLCFLPIIALSSCTKGDSSDSEGAPVEITGTQFISPVCSVVRVEDGRPSRTLCSAVENQAGGNRPISEPERFELTWTEPERLSGADLRSVRCSLREGGLQQECEIALSQEISTFVRVTLTARDRRGIKPLSTDFADVQLPYSVQVTGVGLQSTGVRSVGRVQTTQSGSGRGAVASLESSEPAPGIERIRVLLADKLLPFQQGLSAPLCELNGTLYSMSRTHLYAIEKVNGQEHVRVMAGSSTAVNVAGPLKNPAWVRFDNRPQLLCRPGKSPGEGEVLVVFSEASASHGGAVSSYHSLWIARYPEKGPAELISFLPKAKGDLAFAATLTGAVLGKEGEVFVLDNQYVMEMNEEWTKNRELNALDKGTRPVPQQDVFPRILRLTYDGETSLHFDSRETQIPEFAPGALSIKPDVDRLYGAFASNGAGTFYFANPNFAKVWKLDPEKKVSVVLGTGVAGHPTLGGDAVSSRIFEPTTLYVDKTGDLLVGTTGPPNVNDKPPVGAVLAVRKGKVRLVASGANAGLAFPTGPKTVSTLLSVSAAQIPYPIVGLTERTDGSLLIASGPVHLYRLDLAGMVEHLSGRRWDAYVKDCDLTEMDKDARTPFLGMIQASLIDRQNRPVLYDHRSQQILRIQKDADGREKFRVLVGGSRTHSLDNCLVLSAQSSAIQPVGPVTDLVEGPDGSIFFAEMSAKRPAFYQTEGHRVGRILPDGSVEIIAGNGGRGMYTLVDGALRNSRQLNPTGQTMLVNGSDSRSLYLQNPQRLAVSAAGEVYVSETQANLVLKLTPYKGTPPGSAYRVSVVAGTGARWSYECGRPGPHPCSYQIPLDGTVAQGAPFDLPLGLSFTRDGSLLIQTNSFEAAGLFKLDASGRIYRVGGGVSRDDFQKRGPFAERLPALQVPLNPVKMSLMKPGVWLMQDAQERIHRVTEDEAGVFYVEPFFDRANVAEKCGATTIVGTAEGSSLDSTIRASLNSICVNALSSLSAFDSCGKPGGMRRVLIGAYSDYTIGSGILIDAQSACPN